MILTFLPRCPNPLDPALQQSVLLEPQPPSPQGHTRRFKISTFQFLEDNGLGEQKEEVRALSAIGFCDIGCWHTHQNIDELVMAHGKTGRSQSRVILEYVIYCKVEYFYPLTLAYILQKRSKNDN